MSISPMTLPMTQFEFRLPRGLVDAEGRIHQNGVMRLTTARDEMFVQKQVQKQLVYEQQRSPDYSIYGTLILLSQVITQLGDYAEVTPELLENLFTLDLAYLREFYNRINQEGDARVSVQCPSCKQAFEAELALAGES